MANVPDTFFVTGLSFQQLPANQIYVTPTNGVQTTLANALASGTTSTALTKSAVVANTTLGTLPANSYILYALFRETAGHSVNIAIGSTSGGSDVASAFNVPASGATTATTQAFSVIWFSASVSQTLYISSASWGGASVNCQLVYQVGP